MNRKSAWLGVLLVLGVVSCGGEGDGLAGGRDGSGGTGGDPSNTAVEIGSITGGSFQENVLGISNANLSAGGSTSLTVRLQTSDGAAYTESVDVNFSSDCQSSGFAEIEETNVTTTTGSATTTYVAKGCSGSDTITARATVNGQSLTATGSLTVAPAEFGSIEFVSATPANIGLKGTGGTDRSETSTVVFRMLDATGGPVPQQEASFALSTDVGGITLSTTSGESDSNGRVQTVVKSGTRATTVRVIATAVGENISTQSDQLTITTGIPDQDSFSLSATQLNPESWNVDGVEVEVTARLADRFNNPVPDGTAVQFEVEGASIGSQCTTLNGACSVTWVSQDPRPDSGVLFEKGSGRVTIMATATGEESFSDLNGNGIRDNGEPFDDIPEIYRDDNEDNSQAGEEFFDFNNSGSWDDADGEFTGVLCEGADCSSESTRGIGENLVVTMSHGQGFWDLQVRDTDYSTVLGTSLADATAVLPAVPVGGYACFKAFDLNGNPLPAGTTISLEATGTEIAPDDLGDLLSSNVHRDDMSYTCIYVLGDDGGDGGSLEVETEAPSGIKSFTLFTTAD